jgi:hypothetical protein
MWELTSTKAGSIIDRIAHIFYDHVNLLEEARRGIALTRAFGGTRVDEVVESFRKLKLSRAKLLEELKALRGVELLDESDLEDLIALLGYYVEVAYASELKVLSEARGLVDVEEDLEDLESLRREAKIIMSDLLRR